QRKNTSASCSATATTLRRPFIYPERQPPPLAPSAGGGDGCRRCAHGRESTRVAEEVGGARAMEGAPGPGRGGAAAAEPRGRECADRSLVPPYGTRGRDGRAAPRQRGGRAERPARGRGQCRAVARRRLARRPGATR